jgi:OPA family glycerol-3-phosphate transporter-like MFS transporter 1/2
VVAVMGNWFGPHKRGLIMGVWAAHMTTGNIVGAVLGAQMLQYGWGWAFALPGLLLLAFSAVLWFCLAPHPEDVGYASPTNPHHHHVEAEVSAVEEEEGCYLEEDSDSREGLPEPAVPFLTALRLPGVITYAMALFFSKLIAYTFLYWLPFYVGSTGASKAPPKPSPNSLACPSYPHSFRE